MGISLILTIRNEEKTIESFFDSIFLQTELPNEIVIVDGGSNDLTTSVIVDILRLKKYTKISKITMLIKKKGNRSVGRNFGIGKSKNEIIAITDAGVILDKNWLKNITEPFKDKTIDVVAGFYKPVVKNIFEKCLSTYTCIMPDKIDKDFLPSSRSIAFKKKAWEKVGGYPENLDTCEDLVFARKLKRFRFNFFVQKKAIVYWSQRENIWEAFKQFFSYAKGDGQALYIRPQTPFLFLRYIVLGSLLAFFISQKELFYLFLFIFLFLMYIFWTINKNFKYIKNYKAVFILPQLQIVSDIAVQSGMVIGLINSLVKNIMPTERSTIWQKKS